MKRPLLLAVLVACGPSHPPSNPHTPPATPDASVGSTAVKDPPPPELRLPGGVSPSHGALDLRLDPDQEAFEGDVDFTIDVTTAQDVLWLNGQGLKVISATLDKQPLTQLATSNDDFLGFRASAPIAAGSHELAIVYSGTIGHEMSGLFREQDNGHWYIYSQGEAISARKYMPCFDEPSFKIPWQVRLTVPAEDRGYNNGALLSDTPNDTEHTLTFAETPPIPSYLVAVAVGPFEEIDAGAAGRARIPTRVIVPAGHTAETKTTVAQLPKIIAALEDYFDMALPFDKEDIIVVPTFFGAMENPGLVTFDGKILLAAGADDDVQFRQNMTSIIAHELAHQWFGDYVTLAWWDDLWLNESFATWMADKITAGLEPTWDHVSHELDSANKAKGFDGRLTAQPLRRTITASSQIEGTFDAIAYDKGGAVLTMFEQRIGADKFKEGVRAYMKAHARGNATADDFVAALDAASSADVGDAFHAYLDKAGVPLVQLSLGANGLHAHQVRLVGFGEQPTDEVWPIQLCVDTSVKKKVTHTCQVLTAADTDLPLCAKGCDWVAANDDGTGYYRTSYDAKLVAGLRKHLREVPATARMVVAADVGALLDAGQVGAGEALSLVPPLLATKDVHDLGGAVDLIAATEPLVDDAMLPAWRAWVIVQVGKAAGKAPLAPPDDESPAQHDARVSLLRLDGAVARDRKLEARAAKAIAPWLAGKADLPRDPDVVLAIAARGGDATLFDALLAKARAAEGNARAQILGSLGFFTDPALIARADDLLTTGEFDIFQVGAILQAQLQSLDGARVVAQFIRDHWDAVASQLPKLALPYLVYMQAPAACDTTGRAAVEDFMKGHADTIPNGAKATADTLAEADQCIARKAALAGDLATIIGKRR